MTRCGVCGHLCVPLADYDAPTCARCDLDAEAVLYRAHLARPAPAAIPPPAWLPAPRPRTKESYYGPAAPHVIDELIAALYPNDHGHRRRTPSAIAPGRTA